MERVLGIGGYFMRAGDPAALGDLVLGTGISRVVIAWLEPGLFVTEA
jgi:hypothetical protein